MSQAVRHGRTFHPMLGGERYVRTTGRNEQPRRLSASYPPACYAQADNKNKGNPMGILLIMIGALVAAGGGYLFLAAVRARDVISFGYAVDVFILAAVLIGTGAIANELALHHRRKTEAPKA
jgi:hypothetical protein